MSRASYETRLPSGTRISVCVYVDPPIGIRKALLNKLRSGGAPDLIKETQGSFGSVSSVSSAPAPLSAAVAQIERSLGMTLANLRGVLLGRGANAGSLLLTAARLADEEVVTQEQLRDVLYEAYQDYKGFLDGTHETCESGGKKLPDLSITESPDPWATEEG